MPRYLLRPSLSHLSFRIPSILAAGKLFGFPIKFISEDHERGALVIELERSEHIHQLLARCMAIMWVGELYAEGKDYEELHAQLQPVRARGDLDQFDDNTWKISVEASNLNLSGRRQRKVAMDFPYIGTDGKVQLNSPEVEYLVFEDYDYIEMHTKEQQAAREGQFERVYFVRRIGHTQIRPLISKYAVNTREYYGNTSMEAEMSLLMAEQTLAGPSKIVYDPFAGTGSLLYACAIFGAMVIGSDIDGRQLRGKGLKKGMRPGVIRTASQYGVEDKLLDCMTFDVTRHPLRRGGWLDAIITDPPYGVRAGAKRLGKKPEKGRVTRDSPYELPDGTYAHQQPGYLPPSRPYELSHLTLDLIRLARYMLVPKGRLVFFLPTVTEEYEAIDIPVVEGMRELKWGEGSVQEFGKWGRRMITMEKTAKDDGPAPAFNDYSALDGKTVAHQDFNQRYFAGFAPKSGSETPVRVVTGPGP